MSVIPDLNADIVPGVCAAGFSLGEELTAVQERLGVSRWYEFDKNIKEALKRNAGWLGVISYSGTAVGLGEITLSLVYGDDSVCLEFGKSGRLYRILVGQGYLGKFESIEVGAALMSVAGIEFDFNDADDDFLIIKNHEYVGGISVMTDYRASLQSTPNQRVSYISVHNWMLRG